MKKSILFAAALILLAACSKDENNEPEPEKKLKRTVLVYIAGDNNLTGSSNRTDYLIPDLRARRSCRKKTS